MSCPHQTLYKGSHPSFNRKWLCADCGKLIVVPSLTEYYVVLCAMRKDQAGKRA